VELASARLADEDLWGGINQTLSPFLVTFSAYVLIGHLFVERPHMRSDLGRTMQATILATGSRRSTRPSRSRIIASVLAWTKAARAVQPNAASR
jgi:hypothetical protein